MNPPLTANEKDSDFSTTEQHSDNGSLPPREVQRNSRQLIKKSTSTRVASKERRDRSFVPEVGRTRSRSVCVSEISNIASLRERRRRRPECSLYRRIQSNVALQTGMDLSSSDPDSTYSPSSQRLHRSLPASSAEVVQGILESRHKEPGNSPTLQDKAPSGVTLGPSNPSVPTTSSSVRIGSLENTGWASYLKDWTADGIALLQSAWRKSSLKTYHSAWTSWCRWAKTNNVDHNNPGANELARLMCFLHTELKLAPIRILVHKSVVCTFANAEKS
nr:unnamed protein product [Callosobruchus analis]